jgi:hypothetical protein
MRRRLSAFAILAVVSLGLRAETPEADRLIDRTSREVVAYVEKISDVTCTEQVSQVKLASSGKVVAHDQAGYSYFVLLQGNEHDLLLSESRVPQSPEHKAERNVSLLLTNGFSMLFLIFHPYYAPSYHFEPRGEEMVDGVPRLRVHFRPIPGARTPAALAVRGREYPLELTGDAWLDPDTGMVARIQASLADSLADVGVKSLQVDVEYTAVHLPAWPRAYMFPATTTVEVETARQHWRNIHRFSNYKSFMVSTEQNVADDKLAGDQTNAEKDKKRKK